MNITFTKPVNFEGKEYPGLEMDLESLTGNDLIKAEKQTRAMGDRTPTITLSQTYHAVVAAKATKTPVELITSLPARDFTKVTIEVQNFLLESV